MSVHLLKLSAGCESVEQLEGWQAARKRDFGRVFHRTRMMPRRAAELTAGGSIYWVIKGEIRARQRVLAVERETGRDGILRTLLILEPGLVRTVPRPQRAFQGWRYLEPRDAPADLDGGAGDLAEMPAEMLAELRSLGLL
jgi:hypothetical protein